MIDFNTFKNHLKRVFPNDQELNNLPLEKILEAIPRVDDLNYLPPGTTVLIRADIDAPIKDGKVADMSRIESDLETIRYCYEKKWRIIIFGHVGRNKKNSAAPICEAMSDCLNLPIRLIEDWLDEKNDKLTDDTVDLVKNATPGSIFMLQNTRKYSIEQALWDVKETELPNISKQMYKICNDIRNRVTSIEINEAIASSNIDFSCAVIPLVMSHTCFGFYITNELKNHIRGARKSNLVIFSGLKIDKLNDLEGILERGQLKMIITAGSLATALLKANAQLAGSDFCIGLAETDSSLKVFISQKRIDQAKRIIKKCKKQKVDLVLPTDFILDTGEHSRNIPKNHTQMDIGPESRILITNKIKKYISDFKNQNKPFAMYYSGTFGKFEDSRFEEGTKLFIPLLKEMTKEGISTYVGGGEGRMALLKYGSINDVTHAFTCGGTILKSLTNKHIAYLKALYIQNTLLK